MKQRIAGVDALRATALLAVVLVNVAGYRSLPDGGPLPALGAGDGPLAWLLTVLVATLLQGKGVALLTLLFGYSLALAAPMRARGRLDRLLGLGLLHGFLVYCGDILSSYAICAYAVLARRQERLAAPRRRALRWLIGGSLWLSLPLLIYTGGGAELGEQDSRLLVARQGLADWLLGNAAGYLSSLLAGLLFFRPMSYGLMLVGLLAGRLRLLHHRRWRPLWRRMARWAGPLLLLNLGYGLLYAQALGGTQGAATWVGFFAFLLGPLSLLGFVPWLLLRRWPDWLVRAGRNTLSVYLGSSVAAVLLWAPFGLGLQTGVAAAYALALLVWLLLTAAAAARPQLPLERWMAQRGSA